MTSMILTKKRFAKLVEDKIKDRPMPHIDAVVEVCEDRDLDPGDIANINYSQPNIIQNPEKGENQSS